SVPASGLGGCLAPPLQATLNPPLPQPRVCPLSLVGTARPSIIQAELGAAAGTDRETRPCLGPRRLDQAVTANGTQLAAHLADPKTPHHTGTRWDRRVWPGHQIESSADGSRPARNATALTSRLSPPPLAHAGCPPPAGARFQASAVPG